MKYLILVLAVTLTACGGGDSSVAMQANPFQEALGKPLPTNPSIPAPTDPFAPVLKPNGG